MGLPFFMWGGGDGGSDINRSGQSTSDVPAGPAGVAGAAGAAGVMGSPDGLSEDEQIYGSPSATSGNPSPPADGWGDMPKEGLEGNYEDAGWMEGEELRDPWSQGSDEGLFGGGGESGGSGGDWGDWS